jgi:RND family efflux transporter MFP subunit
VLAVAVFTIGGLLGTFFLWRSSGYITTDNARVTTTIIPVTTFAPGVLERWALSEGQQVSENEVLGWVENGELLRSPVNGLVMQTSVVQAQQVTPGETIAFIASTGNIHVLANIEETAIAKLKIGQQVRITIDTFGRRQFSGIVREIGRATNAELSDNALFFNTGGTFTRVTHLIPVEIAIININDNDDITLAHFVGVNARVRIFLRKPILATHTRNLATNENAANITVRGIVESVTSRNVYTTLRLVVERVYVEAGDRVVQGQVLGRLNTEDLNIELASAEAGLQLAQINFETAEYNLEIRQTLYNERVISRDELRQTEFAYRAAVALRQQAEAHFEAARIALVRSSITSPIDGTVTAVIAKEGSIGEGLLFVVEDTDNLKITTRFREHDISRVRTGMNVAITSDALGSSIYEGVITRINPAATINAPTVEFEAEVRVTSENTSLQIGMNALLTINVSYN